MTVVVPEVVRIHRSTQIVGGFSESVVKLFLIGVVHRNSTSNRDRLTFSATSEQKQPLVRALGVRKSNLTGSVEVMWHLLSRVPSLRSTNTPPFPISRIALIIESTILLNVVEFKIRRLWLMESLPLIIHWVDGVTMMSVAGLNQSAEMSVSLLKNVGRPFQAVKIIEKQRPGKAVLPALLPAVLPLFQQARTGALTPSAGNLKKEYSQGYFLAVV
jgi:hypothetical protein